MQKEERSKAIDDLNGIQHSLFEHCVTAYGNKRMDEFWNDIEGLDVLLGLSNKMIDEDLIDV